MSKIIQAINAMISNPDKISKVIENNGEIFFLYNRKYKWSIAERDQEYWLWFYPGNLPLENIAAIEWDEETDIPIVKYNTISLNTKEAKASFAELYSLVKEKLYGMDTVLRDIIEDDLS